MMIVIKTPLQDFRCMGRVIKGCGQLLCARSGPTIPHVADGVVRADGSPASPSYRSKCRLINQQRQSSLLFACIWLFRHLLVSRGEPVTIFRGHPDLSRHCNLARQNRIVDRISQLSRATGPVGCDQFIQPAARHLPPQHRLRQPLCAVAPIS